MKTIIIISVIFAVFFLSCKKKDESANNVNFNEITGTYKGQITQKNAQTYSATADVTKANDEAVYIHCYGNDLDTSFMLNVYENGDEAMVCYSGQDFENEYGHPAGNHMMHSSGGTAWQHHMDDEHDVSDNHYGSFDMSNHSFSYTFNMDNAESFEFYGNRQ